MQRAALTGQLRRQLLFKSREIGNSNFLQKRDTVEVLLSVL